MTFIPMATHSNMPITKKCKIRETNSGNISNSNQVKFKVLKKLHIQCTRTNPHINYLRKCLENKLIPKALRINIVLQVPVISSTLRHQWEEAQLNFGYSLNKLLLNYWEIQDKNISEEIGNIQEIVKSSTDSEEFDFMISITKRYFDDVFMIW